MAAVLLPLSGRRRQLTYSLANVLLHVAERNDGNALILRAGLLLVRTSVYIGVMSVRATLTMATSPIRIATTCAEVRRMEGDSVCAWEGVGITITTAARRSMQRATSGDASSRVRLAEGPIAGTCFSAVAFGY